MSKKVLVIGSHSDYLPHRVFGEMTTYVGGIESNAKNIGLVVLTGGADISPSLYGQKKNPHTYDSKYRDDIDGFVYHFARKYNIPIAGICRGGQYLTAMAGGFLYQHTTGHEGGYHKIVTSEGASLEVTSCHHQMFGHPLVKGAIELAWTDVNRSSIYELESRKDVGNPEKELEVVYYPSINGLAVQYHPEWMRETSRGVIYYRQCIKNYLFNQGTLKCQLAV